MTNITIPNLEDFITIRLQVRAAEHGRSMEEEARDILRCALAEERQPLSNLVDSIRSRFAGIGFVDLPEIPREPAREPPGFGDDA